MSIKVGIDRRTTDRQTYKQTDVQTDRLVQKHSALYLQEPKQIRATNLKMFALHI
jgi:hypothetical protein